MSVIVNIKAVLSQNEHKNTKLLPNVNGKIIIQKQPNNYKAALDQELYKLHGNN